MCFHLLCRINKSCVEFVVRKFYLFLLVLSNQYENTDQKHSWMQFLKFSTPRI